MLNRPVEPQPVKKIFPPFFNAPNTVSLICSALPDSANSRNFAITSLSTWNSKSSALAISCFATSLRFAVTGCDDSVTSAPSLNWPLILKNSSDRLFDASLIVLRQRLAPRRVQQSIPFLAREFQLRGFSRLANALRIDGADDRNNFARVLRQPRKRNHRAAHAMRIRDGLQIGQKF